MSKNVQNYQIVVDCGQLWSIVVEKCLKLSKIIRLWLIVVDCGRLWLIVHNCAQLCNLVPADSKLSLFHTKVSALLSCKKEFYSGSERSCMRYVPKELKPLLSFHPST